MDRFLHGLFLFAAALWCGLLAAFTAGAGIVLRASPSRGAGGAVNRELLDRLDEASYAAIAVLFVLFLFVERSGAFGKLARGMTVRLLVVAAAATVVSHLVITPEMSSLREAAGAAFDSLPRTDQLRAAWGRLHGLSVLALLVRLGASAGLFAFGFSALRPQRAVFAPPVQS